jgi:hypothetical protein
MLSNYQELDINIISNIYGGKIRGSKAIVLVFFLCESRRLTQFIK